VELIGDGSVPVVLRDSFPQSDSLSTTKRRDPSDTLGGGFDVGELQQVRFGFGEALGNDSGECHLPFDQGAGT
jgi:hypothetical protein